MNISELSIRRPVLSTVLTIIILLFGFIGYSYLGVREFPSVDNPIISVTCSYPGANADVIENQITEPLEQNINGIPGIRCMTKESCVPSAYLTSIRIGWWILLPLRESRRWSIRLRRMC